MSYNILGINPGHNGSAALVSDGKLVYYVEEERLSRAKYDGNPFRAILDILSKWHVDEIVIGGTTLYPCKLPWTNEDPYSALVRKFNPSVKISLLGEEHHLGHTCCAFYNSGFDKAISIVVDGAGSFRKEIMDSEGKMVEEGFETESVWVCEYPNRFSVVYKTYGNNQGQKITMRNLDFDGGAVTITKAYEAVSDYLGFGFIEAGKTMGLAPYGKKDKEIPELFIGNRATKDLFIPFYPAGAFIDKHRFPQFLQENEPKEWHKDPSKLKDIEKNLAWQIQQDTQRLVGDYIEKSVEVTGIENVVISGGYGLNCVANYYFKKRFPNLNIYCEPIAHDGGTSIGIAKYMWHQRAYELGLKVDENNETQTTIYYGPKYDLEVIDKAVKDNETNFDSIKVEYSDVAKLIAERNIVTLFQGRSDAGPRALGNRSILYDPTDPNGKDFVNLVKGREWFRPFAGSCLKEDANEWFDMAGLEESPFMMYAVNVVADKVKKIPCISHVDDTCRIQTVTKEQNEHYYNLISAFKDITGVPIVFNTSFNLAGEPLVETIEDAIRTVLNCDINYLWLPELGILLKKKIKKDD